MKALRVLGFAALLAACAFSLSRPTPSPFAAMADVDPIPAPEPPEVPVEAPARTEPPVKRGDLVGTTRPHDVVRPAIDLQRAEAEWVASQHDFARQKQLCAIDCVTRDFEAAEDAFRKARAKHERARARALPP